MSFVLSAENAKHRELQARAKASRRKYPWFIAKKLAFAKDPRGAVSIIVAKDRGMSFRYFRKAARPATRELRQAHKDFVQLNVNAVPAT